MHEMSLALQIIDIVIGKAREEGAGRVTCVEVEVGSLAGVMGEALEFCFEAAAKDTPVEQARLVLIHSCAEGVCGDCSSRFDVQRIPACCPVCGEYRVQVFGGQELKIKAIHIED